MGIMSLKARTRPSGLIARWPFFGLKTQLNGRKAMAGLNDAIRNAFPGGIGKPLMLGLGALLASGVLTRGLSGQTASAGQTAGTGQTASTGSQPATDTNDAGGVLGGLGGLLNKLQQGGLGDQTNSWVGSGQNQPVSPGQLSQALGPNIIKTLSQMTGVSEDELTKQLSQGIPVIVNTLTPNGRLPTVAELSKFMGQPG
jgi:uncharacterized protein YidB (DUF937 family)